MSHENAPGFREQPEHRLEASAIAETARELQEQIFNTPEQFPGREVLLEKARELLARLPEWTEEREAQYKLARQQHRIRNLESERKWQASQE